MALLIRLLAVAAAVRALKDDVDDDKQMRAFHVSPQDKIDKYKVTDDDTFHAPTVAPNDPQADVVDPDEEDIKNSRTTRKDAEKGSKGAVILADYDSTRLGVSADEAKTGTKGEEKKEKSKGKPASKPQAAAKPKKKNPEDVEHAVNGNKASSPPEPEDVAEHIENTRLSKDDEREATNLQNLEESAEDPKALANQKAQAKDADPGAKLEADKEAVQLVKGAKSAQATSAGTAVPTARKSGPAKALVSKAAAVTEDTETGLKTETKWLEATAVAAPSKPGVVTQTEWASTVIATARPSKAAASSAAAIAAKDVVTTPKPIPTRKATPGELAAEDAAKIDEFGEELESETDDGHYMFSDRPLHTPEVESSQLSRLLGAAVMIVVSELGDKTFFIAALMAMRHNPWFVFSSSYAAMFVMTVMSMVLGLVLPTLLSKRLTTLLAAALFFVFAAKMLREAWGMPRTLMATEELEEVEQDLVMEDRDAANEKLEGGGQVAERRRRNGLANLVGLVCSPVWIQIFSMTFLAEWGDRSQIATVAMGAGEGFVPVLIGCFAGQFITTAIAILGGKILAKKLSLRTITFGGAACFLMFGVFNLGDWLTETA